MNARLNICLALAVLTPRINAISLYVFPFALKDNVSFCLSFIIPLSSKLKPFVSDLDYFRFDLVALCVIIYLNPPRQIIGMLATWVFG